MYPVSANFHTLAIQDAPKTRVRIYFIGDAIDCTDDNAVQTNGTLLVGKAGDTDSNGRIGQNGITFSEFFNPDKNIQVGAAVSSQIGMTLLNTDGALDNFQYGRCKVYLDVYDAANSSWLTCPMGVYIIDLPTRRKSQLIHAFGYDQMQKLDGICDSWWNSLNWTGGITLLQIVNSMASQIGVSVSTAAASAIVNSSVTYPTAPFDCVETTYREVLELIAEATGTVARFDRDGALDLKWFGAAQIGGNTVEIDTDAIGNQCLSIDLAEYQVAAIDLLKVKIAEDDVGVTVGSGTNQYTILDNLFLDGSVATITTRATPIYTRLNALGAYKPIQSKLIWDWSIEAGDIIDITRDSTTYNTPIFQQTMTWRGGYVVSEVVNSGDAVRPVSSYDERTAYRVQSDLTTAINTAESAIANIGVNLSPYFNNSLDDVYNASNNPTGYWAITPSVAYISILDDGWAQVVCDNTNGATAIWPIYYNVANTNLSDDKYTMLIELKDVTVSGAVYMWDGNSFGGHVPQYISNGLTVTGNGSLYITLSKTNNLNPNCFTRSGFQVDPGANVNCKVRISIYKDGYKGVYIPYVSSAYNSSVYREQTIYISKASATPSVTANTTWVTDATGNQNTWTTVRPVYDSSYPVLFVATQTQTMANKGGTTCSCTTPAIDQTTTVIDGGHITTGTIDAGVVNVTNLNASNITSGTLSANYISGGTMTVGGLNNTNGYIRILDSTGNYAGGIGYTGMNIMGEEPLSGLQHVLSNAFLPWQYSIYDQTTQKQLANIDSTVVNATDEYSRILLYGYDNGTKVSSAELNAYPYSGVLDHGAYLLLTGPDGLVRLNSDGTYAGNLTMTGGNLTVGSVLGGNLSVNGVLDVTPRRCYATLSSAGWYRVLKLTGSNNYDAEGAGGFIVDFNIVRNVDTTNNEAHKISLMATWNNIKFINEQSVSNTLGITKIRTTNIGSNLYVDIYYGLSTQNTVTVAFNVTCRGGDESKFNSQPFTSVAASPSGETELALYTFAANASGGIITNRVVGSLGSNSVLLPVPSGKQVIGARSAFYAGALWFDGNGDTYFGSFSQIGSQDALTVDYYYY